MLHDLFADLNLETALGDADYPIQDLENFNPDVALKGPFLPGAVFASYAVNQQRGLGVLESKLRQRARDAEGGKFNKTDVWYSPIAPPPGAWDYRCRNCRFYSEGSGDSGGSCSLVGHEGDPLGGESISPEAWCAIWMPEDNTKFLTYIQERMEGEGE